MGRVTQTLLKGRANPMGNHDSGRRACSLDTASGPAFSPLIKRKEQPGSRNRERELGLDRREIYNLLAK